MYNPIYKGALLMSHGTRQNKRRTDTMMYSTTATLIHNETDPASGLTRTPNVARIHYTITGVVMTVMLIFSLVENSLAIWIYFKTKKLHTRCNVLIMAVIFCDLLIVVAGYPFIIVSSFFGKWMFGRTGCNWDGFLVTFLGIASIFLLTALSVHRYVVIVYHGSKVTVIKIVGAIMACFVFGLLWAVCPLLGWGYYEFEGYGISCAPDWRSKQAVNLSYTMMQFVFCLIVPLIVIGYSYYQILRKVWQEKKRRSNWITQGKVKREIRVTVSVALTIGSFLIAWAPYAGVSLCAAFLDIDLFEVSPLLVQLPCLMAKTACVWNPLVYICHHREFRKAFLDFIKRK